MPLRPCLEPGCTILTPRSRCHQHQTSYKTARYGGQWATYSKQAIATYRAQHGDTCPGWNRPAHAINASDWTTDHDLGPLCRACNGAKH